MMSIDNILKTDFVSSLIQEVCGSKTELITRPSCFFVKKPDALEDERDINRVIILPPKGFTANEINQTNCFYSVESAKIEVLGAAREGKSAFSKLKQSLLVVSRHKKDTVSDLNKPYLIFDFNSSNNDFISETYDAGTPPFHVVKPDGTGFYHTLINLTDEWLVLRLHKVLRPQRSVNLTPFLKDMQDGQADILKNLYKAIIVHGDKIFKEEAKLIQSVMNISPQDSLPAIGEMLYIRDTGKHETCSSFALILKISHRHPKQALNYLYKAEKEAVIPSYFANQLMSKIQNKHSIEPLRKTA